MSEKYKFKNEKFPSKEFSLHTGIEGLYKDWIVNIDIEKYEYYRNNNFDDKDQERIDLIYQFYNQIILDNPELSSIILRDSRYRPYDIVSGAISKFIFSDIKFFVENFSNLGEYNINQRSYDAKICRKAGMYPEWVMSPDTQKYIISALNL